MNMIMRDIQVTSAPASRLQMQSVQGYQSGATLLVTLVALLIISIIAVIAFKQSSTDLNISTSSQVNKVVFQSSELGMSMLEQQARQDKLNQDGNLIPHLRMPGTSNDRIGNEITFCIRPRKNEFFNNAKISEKSVNGGHVGLNNGYCNPNASSDDYTSDRKTTVLQMTIEKRKPGAGGEVFELENDRSTLGGTQIGGGGGTPFVPVEFKATSTAVLPAFSATSLSVVSACLKKSAKQPPSSGTTVNDFVEGCMRTQSVPQKTTEQGYVYRVFSGL